MSQCQKDKMGVGLDLGGSASGTVTIEADSMAPREFLVLDLKCWVPPISCNYSMKVIIKFQITRELSVSGKCKA